MNIFLIILKVLCRKIINPRIKHFEQPNNTSYIPQHTSNVTRNCFDYKKKAC